MVGKSPFAHLSRHSSTPNASTDAQQPSEDSSSPPLARRKSTFRLGGGRKSSLDAYTLLPSPSPETQSIRRERRTSSQYGGSPAPAVPGSPTSFLFAQGQPLKKVVTNDSGDSAKSTQKQKRSSRLFSLHKKDSSASTHSTALPLPVLEPLSPPRPPPRPTRSVPPTPAPPINEEFSPAARSRIPLFHSPPTRSRTIEHDHRATSSDLSSILPSILPSFPEVQSSSKGPAQLDDSPLLSVQALSLVESPPGSPEKEAQRRESDNLIDEEIEEPRPLKVWEEEGDVISDVGGRDSGAAAVEQVAVGEQSGELAEGLLLEGLPDLTSEWHLSSLPPDDLASTFVSNYPSSSNTSPVASPEHLENLSPLETPGEDIPFLHLEDVIPREVVEVPAPDDETLERAESDERVAKASEETLVVEEEEEEVVEILPSPPVETPFLEKTVSPLATRAPTPPSPVLTWSEDTLVPSEPASSPVDTAASPSLVDKALTAALVCAVAQDVSIVANVQESEERGIADEAVSELVSSPVDIFTEKESRVELETTIDQLAPLDVQIDDTPVMQVDLATLPPLPPSPAVVIQQDLPKISTESTMPSSPLSDHQHLESTSVEEEPAALIVPSIVSTDAADAVVDFPIYPDPDPQAPDDFRSTEPSDQISEAENDVPPLGQDQPDLAPPSVDIVQSNEPSDQIPAAEKDVSTRVFRPALTITVPDETTKEEKGTDSHPTESAPSDTLLSAELTTISVTLASLTLALFSTKSLATYQRFLVAAGCLGAHSIFHFAAGLFKEKGRFSEKKKGLLDRGTAALGLGGRRRLPPHA